MGTVLRPRPGAPATGLAVLFLGLTVPWESAAQVSPHGSWTVIPSVGFGTVRSGEGWASAGLEAGLEVQRARGGWLGYVHLSHRGIGVGCSAADARSVGGGPGCFDGGPGGIVGFGRASGRVLVGVGVGGVKDRSEAWLGVVVARASVTAGPIRFDGRIELPLREDAGTYLPVRIGIPLGE